MFELINYDHLPATMQELGQEIGKSALIKLLEVYHNRKLYVPMKVSEKHYLFDLIGQEAFEKLVFYRAGLYIVFPACKAALNDIRDRRIKAKRKDLTLQQLAHEFQLTATRISMICRQPCLS